MSASAGELHGAIMQLTRRARHQAPFLISPQRVDLGSGPPCAGELPYLILSYLFYITDTS